MLVYEHRTTPAVTPAKLNDRERQTFPNREPKGPQKLRNLQ